MVQQSHAIFYAASCIKMVSAKRTPDIFNFTFEMEVESDAQIKLCTGQS
jgi:hypothetical protein